MTQTERETMVRPFLRWVGGKQRLFTNLKDFLPPLDKIRAYHEPFLGAGSLFLGMGFRKAYLSDLNPHLINAFEQIKLSPGAVDAYLRDHECAMQDDPKAYYDEQKAVFNATKECFDLVQAARFIFLIHTNFNGVYRVNSKGIYNVPYGKVKRPNLPKLDHLQAIAALLQNACIDNCHYSDIEPRVREGDLVYLDPPYPALSKTAHFNGYTIDRFSEKDQRELAAFANRLRMKGAMVMISNADVELIRELYPFKHWYLNNTKLFRNVSAKRPAIKVGELIITSYPRVSHE